MFYSLKCSDVIKINSFLVKNELIYHPTFKTNILFESYILIEGDKDNTFIVQLKTLEIIILETTCVDIVNNNSNIITRPSNIVTHYDSTIATSDIEYLITSRLLSLIKRFNINIKILLFLLNKIGAWFSLNGTKLKIL